MKLLLFIIVGCSLVCASTQNHELPVTSAQLRALADSLKEETARQIDDVKEEIARQTENITKHIKLSEYRIKDKLENICNTLGVSNGNTTEQTTEKLKQIYAILQNHLEPEFGTTTPPMTTNQVVQTYTCGGTAGWRQVSFINMTDTSYNCPPGLHLTSFPKRTCGPPSTLINTQRGCSSTMFSVNDTQYSRVCGRIIGYTFYYTCPFLGYLTFGQRTIDGYYVDGVSLTHGAAGQRRHIWSFASGVSEVDTNSADNKNCYCPCASNELLDTPPFVGNDYFCESGLNTPFTNQRIFYPDDPIWDGENCPSGSTCCQFNNPPWFSKTLPNPTTDDIELRLCSRYFPNINAPIEVIELYIQ